MIEAHIPSATKAKTRAQKQELEVEATIRNEQGYAQGYGVDTTSVYDANDKAVVDIDGLLKTKTIYVLDPTIVIKRHRD